MILTDIDTWEVVWEVGKARRQRLSLPGQLYGFVMLNQSTRNVEWAISTDPDQFYYGNPQCLLWGSMHVNRPDLKPKPCRELAMAAAKEMVEYLLQNLGEMGVTED